MGIDSLVESADAIESFLRTAEIAGNPVNLSPFGEPQLGKRGLYPTMHTAATRGQSADGVDGRTQLDRILLMLNMADGHTPMADVADACGCSIVELADTVDTLESNDLLSFTAPPLAADR